MHSYSHLVELFHKEETESEEADARNLRTTHRKAAKTKLDFVYYSLLFVVTRMGTIRSSTSPYFARALICLLLRLRRRIRFLAHLALILKHGKELPLLVTALLFGATTQRQRTKPTRSDEYQNVIVPWFRHGG